MTVIRGRPGERPSAGAARCYDMTRLHEVQPADASLVRAAIDALGFVSMYSYGFSPYYSVRRLCIWRVENFPAYAAVSYSSMLPGHTLHLREDVSLLALGTGLKPAFNFAVLHEILETKYITDHARDLVESAIATGAAAHVPREVLERFADILVNGILNEHIFVAYELTERDPETLVARGIMGEGILPLPGAVWVIPHPVLRDISRAYTSRYPELARGSHRPYWEYAETCLHKVVAWGLPGGRYPESARDVVYAVTWEHALSRILERLKHSGAVLDELKAGDPGAREYLVWFFTAVCGLPHETAERLADELARRNATVYRVVEHTLESPDPQGGPPCVMKFTYTYHVPCPSGRCPPEGKCTCARGACVCDDPQECGKADVAAPADIDPRKIAERHARPPGTGYEQIVLDFRVKRVRAVVPPVGGRLFETRKETGRPKWVTR
jgi:hypothetical protein